MLPFHWTPLMDGTVRKSHREQEPKAYPPPVIADPLCDTLMHEDALNNVLDTMFAIVRSCGLLSCREFTNEELVENARKSASHFGAIHVRSFGSELYKPKTLGELQALLKAALEHGVKLIDEARAAAGANQQ